MSEKIRIRIRILSDNDVTEVMEPPGISLEELAAQYYDRSAGYFPVFASVNDVGRDLPPGDGTVYGSPLPAGPARVSEKHLFSLSRGSQ